MCAGVDDIIKKRERKSAREKKGGREGKKERREEANRDGLRGRPRPTTTTTSLTTGPGPGLGPGLGRGAEYLQRELDERSRVRLHEDDGAHGRVDDAFELAFSHSCCFLASPPPGGAALVSVLLFEWCGT